ncbi:ATP-binding cassette domain-containing protein, partial [Paenibacillus jilunlii]
MADIKVEIPTRGGVGVIRPSGSGTSTSMRCLNFLQRMQEGNILNEGTSLMAKSARINDMRTELGMVFQQFNLFPHQKVIENIMLAPVQVRTWPAQQARRKALELLNKVGLSEQAAAYPAPPSGGPAQRVAIARTLAMEPEIMLLEARSSPRAPAIVAGLLPVR